MTENNAAQPGLNDTIRAVFLEHGFTIKEGQTDLKPYVYQAVHALLSKLRAEGVQAGDERPSLRGAANLAFNALHECKPVKGAEKQYSDAIQALQSALHNIAYTVNRTATPQQFANHLQREARAALASAPGAMIDTAKLAQLLDSVNGDCYLGKEKEEELSQFLRSQLRAPVADESPMAKMADALREKGRQEQQAYQDSRVQSTEWGPMPHGTEADLPASAPVADVKDWRIDTSAGGPILVYKDCSVIESEQAEYVLRLIAAGQASTPVAGKADQPDIDTLLRIGAAPWYCA